MSNRFSDIIRFSPPYISSIKPSEWAEKNRIMKEGTTPIPGKYSFDHTPYWRRVVDHLSPDSPARIVVIMKGAQNGASTGVIETGIGWTISENPSNILLSARDEALVRKMVQSKIDPMIDSSGIRSLIRPTTIKKKNQRTGDTDMGKEFAGGSLTCFSIQTPERARQISAQVGFLDDFEAAKDDKSAGSASSLFETRFAAGYDRMKLYYISTPELKQTSKIEPLYNRGNQERWKWHCPCCGSAIHLEWSLMVNNEKAGIHYKVNNHGQLIDSSVGYICQECGGFFTDAKKFEYNINGFWEATKEPDEPGFFSHHLSSLYSPPGMTPWKQYVRDYLKCFNDGETNHNALKTFYNTCLGLTYEEQGKENDAKGLSLNTRDYQINTIPCEQSINDGHGQIVMITCAADLGGFEDDARLDYEVVAWSADGSSYSITHGSIGTFKPRGGNENEEREKLSYDLNSKNVWTEFEKVLSRDYETDDNRVLNINFTGIDTGHFTVSAYNFIDTTPYMVIGLKGKTNIYKEGSDSRMFSISPERGKLFTVFVSKYKDLISGYMDLKESDGEQQPNFMNFPQPSEGKYTYKDYFKHYEAEQRIVDKTKGVIWQKKNSAVQNHFFDCRVYNLAVRDILASIVCKEEKLEDRSFASYVRIIVGD